MSQGKQQPQHHPADGPAFWNITHNFKAGELESGLSTMFFREALDLKNENLLLKHRIQRLEKVGDELYAHLAWVSGPACFKRTPLSRSWIEAKEAKP